MPARSLSASVAPPVQRRNRALTSFCACSAGMSTVPVMWFGIRSNRFGATGGSLRSAFQWSIDRGRIQPMSETNSST